MLLSYTFAVERLLGCMLFCDKRSSVDVPFSLHAARSLSFLMFFSRPITILAPLLLAVLAFNEPPNPAEVVSWQSAGAQVEGDNTRVLLRLTTVDGFSLYRDKISFQPPLQLSLAEMIEPPAQEITDPLTGEKVKTFFGGEFELLFKGTPPGDTFPFAITYIGCTDKICLFPYTETLQVNVYRTRTAPRPATSPPAPAAKPVSTPSMHTASGASVEQRLISFAGQNRRSLLWLIVIAWLGGLLTNLTPCVLPMIPITLKTLAKRRATPLLSALIYGSGIIFAYSALGIVAAFGGGLFGAILGNLWFTIAFSALMFIFGLTMLGWGNLALLQQLGTKLGQGKASLPNTFCLGLGAGLVAAPCTGPILGALLTWSATQLVGVEAFLLFFVYSCGFALPYIGGGSLITKITRVKLAPRLQFYTKLLMAAMMFALCFYYLRIPFYQQLQNLTPLWFPLSATLLGMGVLLTGLLAWRVSMDRIVALPCALLLGSGLFAFSQGATTTTRPTLVTWMTSEPAAVQQAQAQQRPLLIDGWAEWCERCKQMDAFTWTDPTLSRWLQDNDWLLLKLDFTLTSTETEALRQKYNILSLPSIVLLPASHDKQVIISGYLDAQALLAQLRAFSAAR